MESILRRKWIPLAVAVPLVVLADQVTKALVTNSLPYGRPVRVLGDFLRLVYVQNPGMGFSLGVGLPSGLRQVLVVLLPLAVVGVIMALYWGSKDVSPYQRWLLAVVAGGGVGNLIDRIVRPEGVVDFIDVRFFGIFGLDRWPTFNVADSSVVVAGILLMISYLFVEVKTRQ
jgi:signal peptidase II